MTTGIDAAQLYRLMAWLSPAFPTGGFSYSHGLEYAVEAELVKGRAGAEAWIAGVLRFGAGRSDAQLFALAYRAAGAGDETALKEIAGLASALRGTAELALESRAQGEAFLKSVERAWPQISLSRWSALSQEADIAPSLPVAVALATKAHGIALAPALAAFTQGFAATLVSAAVRLIPLGQSEGLAILAALEPAVDEAVSSALAATPDRLGAAAPMVDWCSMRHETQYTRLFRS
jgi:urease accessory protein